MFTMFSSKKQFKKEMYNERQIEILSRHAGVVTDKIIKEVDVKSLINELASMIPADEFSPGILIGFENDLVGSISYIDSTIDPRIFVITEINTKYTPFATLYKPSTSATQVVRISKDFYNEKPLKQYDTIYVAGVQPRNKRRKIDGKWTIRKNYLKMEDITKNSMFHLKI